MLDQPAGLFMIGVAIAWAVVATINYLRDQTEPAPVELLTYDEFVDEVVADESRFLATEWWLETGGGL